MFRAVNAAIWAANCMQQQPLQQALPMITRRQALKSAAAVAAAPFILTRAAAQNAPVPTGPHKLPPLGYAFDMLEPHIDAQTMQIHHDKHHAAYVNNLNKALADYPDLQKLSVEDLLKDLNRVPEKIRNAVRNNAGGHYNHTLFWQCLKKIESGGPEGALAEALEALFGDKDQAHQKFLDTALGVFGSGWVWVTVDKDKKLKLESTPNQDSPLSQGRVPLYGLDVWEHAYYLKYQNRRVDYVKAAMECVNWEFLQQRFEKLTA
jgi:Fe-Mn family superoxide dismutase